jgi:hypothetical protein
MDKGPKNIYDFKTLNGEIDVQASKKSSDFCEGLDQYVISNKEIANL